MTPLAPIRNQVQLLALDSQFLRSGGVYGGRYGEVDLIEHLADFCAEALSNLGFAMAIPFCDPGVFEERVFEEALRANAGDPVVDAAK